MILTTHIIIKVKTMQPNIPIILSTFTVYNKSQMSLHKIIILIPAAKGMYYLYSDPS